MSLTYTSDTNEISAYTTSTLNAFLRPLCFREKCMQVATGWDVFIFLSLKVTISLGCARFFCIQMASAYKHTCSSVSDYQTILLRVNVLLQAVENKCFCIKIIKFKVIWACIVVLWYLIKHQLYKYVHIIMQRSWIRLKGAQKRLNAL